MKKSVRIFWAITGIGTAVVVLFLVLLNFGVFGEMPSLEELENPSVLQATEIIANDGTLMGKYYLDKGNRSNVKYSDISKHVIDALVSTEDVRFYDHSGIDAKGLIRAVVHLGSDGGASTITQQLAKNMLGQGSKNMIHRMIEKLKELIIAVKLERNFTKEEILALYLNVVPFGDNVYGIRNASLAFFQKEPDRLDVVESAVLIGMLKGNYLYNPRVHPLAAFNRKNTVIDQMEKNSVLTEPESKELKLKPILLKYKKQDENAGLAPYFREELRTDVKAWCKAHINPATNKPYDIYRDGLKIYTTINPRMQIYAEEAVATHMPTLQKILNAQSSLKNGKIWKEHENILQTAIKNSDRWKNMKDEGFSDADIKKSFYAKTEMKIFAWNAQREKDTVMTPYDSIKYNQQMLQTSFMVMDPITGEVKAWVGGIDFRTYKFDHVNLETKRQVGSSIKPFLYCEAIEEAGLTPETPVENQPQDFPGFGMVPAKGDCGKFPPVVTMASALTWSMNCASAYIMKQVTPQRFSNFLQQINIPTKVEPYPSMALGACDLSMFEMLQGYTMFPNRGINTKPIYITRIEDKKGNLLESFQTTMKQVISEQAAYTMVRMMQGPVDFGTAAGLRARLGAAEMGGKTGTTNDHADAWFMGYTPQLLAGAWIGCDARFIHLESSLGDGGKAARPIWEYFFQKVYADKTLGIVKDARFLQPENMNNLPMADWNKDVKIDEPGAGGTDEGNGGADSYIPFDKDTSHVPVESNISADEKKILDEANKAVKKDDGKPAVQTPPEEKKKKGFFNRLFGKKDKNE
ncbi:MAG TPA: transglycosylase domain-containing protein [Chitinophagaceae bacterium]|jgi:penicillin-binding protein 1A|nr:transglycosylase domain-containing protein [Chitinophagaceae bacterium]